MCDLWRCACASWRYGSLFLSAALRDQKNKEENLSMKKKIFRGATEEGTHMAAPSSHSGTRVRSDRRPTTGTPRWVKVFVIVFIILVLLFVILHLTGNGMGSHMHMSIIAHWGQPL